MCSLPPVRPRLLTRFFVAAAGAGLTLLATSCSSPATTKKEVAIKPTTNKGLCKLVSPSVVATAFSVSMNFPVSLIHDSTTECEYLAKNEAGRAAIIEYDTAANDSTFAKSKVVFERRGLTLGPITHFGDQAYYFDGKVGKNTVTTVVVLKGSLQLLVTGSGPIDQIGAIARYALNEYETTHSTSGNANRSNGASG